MINPYIKPTKQAIKAISSPLIKTVSVRNGTGTASGYIYINITAQKPAICTDNPFYCENCKTRINEITKLIKVATKTTGCYLNYGDMGEPMEMKTISIDLIN